MKSDQLVDAPIPQGFPTSLGMLKEADAAAYLAHHMCDTKLNVRRLRYWRSVGRGPVFHQPPQTRSLWYRLSDLDHWLLVDSARDPGE